MLPIVQAPNDVLSAKAKHIKKIDKDVLQLIEEMKATLIGARNPEGIGLAAPQVGKSLQLFIIKQSKEAPFSIFINPSVMLLSDPKSTPNPSTGSGREKKHPRLEGCLSLKDIWGTVKRSPKVKIAYMDEAGKKYNRTFSGFFATIMQHEYDHLQGFLFPKRTLEQQGKLYHSHLDEKGEEVFDLIKL